jgi:hypothetical protein
MVLYLHMVFTHGFVRCLIYIGKTLLSFVIRVGEYEKSLGLFLLVLLVHLSIFLENLFVKSLARVFACNR